ncbi:MAG: Gfo/Idh/MocA family oxidoreductase [Phycisphaerae bacterium]|jgi:predicted dehydrogenase
MNDFGIAIIGASRRSDTMFNFLKHNPDYGFVKGLYDIIPQRGEYFINRYELKQAVIYNTLQQALDDKQVKAVFIGTPDYAHVEPAVESLKAGKHIYCEKPLATTLRDCDMIIDGAKNAKTVFYVGKNLRHSPVHEKLHEILESGKIGKLLTIEANEYYYAGRTYFRRWNRLRKYSGGLWITKACHDFDLLNWFAGGNPRKVFAVSSLSYYKTKEGAGPNCRECKIKNNCPDYYGVDEPEKYKWSSKWDELDRITEETTGRPRDLCLYNSDKDTFDNGIAVVEYDNDTRATYTVNVVSAQNTRQMRLTGTEGSVEGDMSEGKVVYWKRHTDTKELFDLKDKMNSGHGGADDQILKDFFNCCHNNNKPKTGWLEGRLALEVGLAARESCDTGKVIELPLV